ncbi:hypothetical protein B8W96_10110, partial [Lentilactobacillus parakefiri]|uniref:hypothetical protein n=1 Tax=Lentilactobacillus parakefiri TaxID=152332 RepID=UPI000BD1121C
GLVLLEWKYFPTPKILDPHFQKINQASAFSNECFFCSQQEPFIDVTGQQGMIKSMNVSAVF